MVGFLFRLIVVLLVLGVIAVVFEFKWTGDELRVRNRWSKPHVAAPADLPAKAKEKIPDDSRRKLERIIEEAK